MKQLVSLTNIISFLLFIIAFWGITYTSDWEGYEYLFSNQNSSDGLFNYLSSEFIKYGYDFRSLYRFHIVLIAFSFIVLFNICKTRPLYLTVLVLLLFYVEIGNQIRYYLAFPLCFIAYYCYLHNKRVISYLILLLAVFSHLGSVIIAVAIFFVNKIYNKKNLFKYLIGVGIGVYIVYIAGVNIISRFNAYYDGTASLIGGFYLIIPTAISLYLIFITNNRIDSSIYSNLQYRFLLVSSICTSFLLLTAVDVLIITSRFLDPLIIFWLSYFYFLKNQNINKKIKRRCIIYSNLIVITFLLYRYVFPFVFIKSDFYLKALEMITSYSIN